VWFSWVLPFKLVWVAWESFGSVLGVPASGSRAQDRCRVLRAQARPRHSKGPAAASTAASSTPVAAAAAVAAAEATAPAAASSSEPAQRALFLSLSL